MHLPPNSISHILQKDKVMPSASNPPPPSFDLEEAIRRFQAGEGTTVIARSLRIAAKTLRKYIPKQGTVEYYQLKNTNPNFSILEASQKLRVDSKGATHTRVVLKIRDERDTREFEYYSGEFFAKVKKDPEYIFFPSAEDKQERKRLPALGEAEGDPQDRVAYYQAKIDKLCPGQYQVLRRVYNSGLRASLVYEITDIPREVTFLYSIVSVIRLLRKNPNRVFAATKVENIRLHKEAALRSGITKNFIEGKTVREFAEETDSSLGTIKLYVKQLGEEKAIDLLRNKTKATMIEEVVGSWLDKKGIKYRSNRKLEGTPYRPDFVVPECKIIVECDGLYWHSDKNDRIKKNYHRDKKKAYDAVGYRSYFFRDNELLEKGHICQSILYNALGLSTRIGARKTKIVDISDDFFIANHLMGKGSGRKWGLQHEGKIVAGIQVRFKNKAKGLVDISRFCTAPGVSVVGGLSKLLSHMAKEMSPATIQTFVDRRYGTGSHLQGMGFTKETETVSFSWTDFTSTYHRMKFPSNTGYDHGMAKLWDCGQAKWVAEASSLLSKRSRKAAVLSFSPVVTTGDPNTKPLGSGTVARTNKMLTEMGVSDHYEVTRLLETRHTKKGRRYHMLEVHDKKKDRMFSISTSGFISAIRSNPKHEFTDKFGDKLGDHKLRHYQKLFNQKGFGAQYKVRKVLERRVTKHGTYYQLLVEDVNRGFKFKALTNSVFSMLKRNPQRNFTPVT